MEHNLVNSQNRYNRASMASWFSSETYQLKKAAQTPVVRGFLLLALLALVLTLVARWGSVSSLGTSLPPPGLDTHTPEFNAKMNYLEAFARQHGKVDCLLVGSSHIDYGLDPTVITQMYKSKTGQEFQLFNFGLATLTVDTAAPLTKMLVERYHPGLVILEVSAHSFDKYFGDLTRPLIKNPWIRYQLGEQTFEGWLLDNFYIYTYYRTFKLWQNPYSRDIMIDSWKKMDFNGYSAHSGQNTSEKRAVSSFDFHLDQSSWREFQNLLALNGQTHLVLIETPLQETFLPAYIRGGRTLYEPKFF